MNSGVSALDFDHEEDNGTWDVDVYEHDDRDPEFCRGYLAQQEALDYGRKTLKELMTKGTVSFDIQLNESLRVPCTSLLHELESC